MSLGGKVAKLFSGLELKGSAWLISPDMAITALHCIQSEDGVAFTKLNLKFHEIEGDFLIEHVEAKLPKMDIAILKLNVDSTNLSPPIIQISRRSAVEGDNCRMRGHPAISASNHPDGIPITGRILDSALPYEEGNIKCNTICIDDVSVQAQGGTTSLQGISGGPVTLDGDSFSIGVVISETINGNQLRVISIQDIAENIDIVRFAINNSEHTNPVDKNVYISLCDETNKIKWSALLSPAEIGGIWGRNPSLNAQSIICNVPLRYLGKSAKALIRLLAYSNITTCKTLDGSSWSKMLLNLGQSDMCPKVLPTVDNYSLLMDKGLTCYPKRWLSYSSEELASEINSALNLYLIGELSTSLHDCLVLGFETHLGGDIETSLKSKMWENWINWEEELKNDPELLRSYLIRVFSEEGACDTIDNELLMSIGCSDIVSAQLYKATIYALAFSTINISVNPIKNSVGNLSISKSSTGHACGKEYKGGKRFDRVISSVQWETDVVILPFIQLPLIQSYEKSISMTKPDGALGEVIRNIPPIAIIGDIEFLEALESGVSGVQEYYDLRKVEVSKMIADLKVPSRTEPLDV